jgi:hypothetical protein
MLHEGSSQMLNCERFLCAAGNEASKQPLENYRYVKPQSSSWPKVMLDPDATFGHHVHDALNLPGHRHTVIHKACIRVLHLQNLFSKRWHKAHFYYQMTESVDAFHWVFRHAANMSAVQA